MLGVEFTLKKKIRKKRKKNGDNSKTRFLTRKAVRNSKDIKQPLKDTNLSSS